MVSKRAYNLISPRSCDTLNIPWRNLQTVTYPWSPRRYTWNTDIAIMQSAVQGTIWVNSGLFSEIRWLLCFHNWIGVWAHCILYQKYTVHSKHDNYTINSIRSFLSLHYTTNQWLCQNEGFRAHSEEIRSEHDKTMEWRLFWYDCIRF